MKSLPRHLPAAISLALGSGLSATPASWVSGGCIHACYRWESDSGPLFVKVASSGQLDMLQAESEGLQELAAPQAFRIPAVRGVGLSGETSWLALEWLELKPLTERSETLAGEQLALMHRHGAPAFGWRRDNYVGLSPQSNTWQARWAHFFRDRRLRPQLDLAIQQGHSGEWVDRAELLMERVPEFLRQHAVAPSLLHGDLWAGNLAACDGAPVIFDPAVYYGDREADLAMTRLFGGFGKRFYEAYDASWPLPAGASQRIGLYTLYHVLNHLNLFGSAYLGHAKQLIDQLLAEHKT